MYNSNHRITYIDELPPLDELENRASRNRDLIEHYQPSTNSTPTRITNSPYASSKTMYGGDPNMRQNPVPIFPSKVNIQDELHEKEKLFEKANQKLPSRQDNGTFVLPSKMGPNSQEREFEDYGIDVKSFKEQPPHMSYSEDQYVIPDDSFIIYEESNNKRRMNREKPRSPPPRRPQQQSARPNWSNQFPSYHPSQYNHPQPPPHAQHHGPPHAPPHAQHPHGPPHALYPHPHPPPPVPQYYNGHHHNSNQQPHICSLISTHLAECPLCARLYVARKQFSTPKDDDKPRNVNTAIYMIIIIFLIICCVFMFKKMMANKSV